MNDNREAELKAEVERWVEKANEAGKAYADANTKHHEELDRANRLEGMCERLAERAVDYQDAQRAAETALTSEREAHAGLRARLEALADEVDGWTPYDSRDTGETFLAESVREFVADLRAALAAEPAEATASRPPETSGAGSIAPVAAEEGDEQEAGEVPQQYATSHGFTPSVGNPFADPEQCKVMLARYVCPYSREEHDPALPPVDVDVFGYRRTPRPASSGSDEQGHRPATPDANGVHDTKGGAS